VAFFIADVADKGDGGFQGFLLLSNSKQLSPPSCPFPLINIYMALYGFFLIVWKIREEIDASQVFYTVDRNGETL
jgi:hypothetical protein